MRAGGKIHPCMLYLRPAYGDDAIRRLMGRTGSAKTRSGQLTAQTMSIVDLLHRIVRHGVLIRRSPNIRIQELWEHSTAQARHDCLPSGSEAHRL